MARGVVAHLGRRAQGFLQLDPLLLLVQGSLVVVVGDVPEDEGLLGDGQDAALHGGDLTVGGGGGAMEHEESGLGVQKCTKPQRGEGARQSAAGRY